MRKAVFGVVVAVAIGLVPRNAHSENPWIWPRPADQPGVAVPCSQCPPETLNKLTPPYSDPLRFVGRFDNASFVSTRQQPFRTAFAFKVYVDKAHNRLYWKLGSAVSVYAADRFITRLQAREPLMRISTLPGLAGMDPMLIESFLKWDKWFYAEFMDLSKWWTVVVDGEDRLSSIDFDDRGYVYIATSQFGWGILQDDGKADAGFMPSQYQSLQRPNFGDETAPTAVAIVKASNRYYAFVGGSMSVMNIWDVTNPKNPVRKGDFPHTFTVISRTADRVAFKGDDGNIYIYSADGMVSTKGVPLAVVNPPTYGVFLNAVNDGTNFYVMTRQADRTIGITKLVPDIGGTSYSQVAVFQTGKSGSPRSLLAYDSGFISFVYQDDLVGVDGAMFRMTDSGLIEIPLNHYIASYYLGAANSPYVAPRSFPNEIVPLVVGGKVYLIVNSTNLGDVYEVKTNDPKTITVQPDSLNLTVKTTDTAGPSGTLAINGPFGVGWIASSDSSWLSLSTLSGSFPTSATYSIVKSKLVNGTQQGKITFTGIGLDGSNLSATLPATVFYGGPPDPPAGITAWATSTSRVSLTWTACPTATGYEIERVGAGGTYAPVGTSTTNAFTDTPPSGAAAYFYRVRATNAIGVSNWSTPDLATTVRFSDDPILPGVTTVKAAHLTELRDATNAVRRLAGLSQLTFSADAAAGNTITAAHVNELRTAIDEAFQALSLSGPPWTDTISAGSPIKAVHLQELRTRLK